MNERHEVLRDGTRVIVRPLRREDIGLYPDFLAAVTAADLRLRFLAPTSEVSRDLIDKLTHLDYSHAMAFIAIAEDGGKMLGVARLHDDPSGDSAEFAILVRSRLKGHGLGWLLMRRLIEFAKAKGLKTVHGQVLRENTTMLTMCAELGFHASDEPGEFGIKLVTLPLAQAGERTPP